METPKFKVFQCSATRSLKWADQRADQRGYSEGERLCVMKVKDGRLLLSDFWVLARRVTKGGEGRRKGG
jgi:hypothetical protein